MFALICKNCGYGICNLNAAVNVNVNVMVMLCCVMHTYICGCFRNLGIPERFGCNVLREWVARHCEKKTSLFQMPGVSAWL